MLESGRFAALYRPYHLIGLEAGISVASAALRGEPTGTPRGFGADVAAVAKRDLEPGDRLDGEGGFTVRGTVMPAELSLAKRALPIGLAGGVRVNRSIRRDELVTAADVELDESDEVVRIRRELEQSLATACSPRG